MINYQKDGLAVIVSTILCTDLHVHWNQCPVIFSVVFVENLVFIPQLLQSMIDLNQRTTKITATMACCNMCGRTRLGLNVCPISEEDRIEHPIHTEGKICEFPLVGLPILFLNSSKHNVYQRVTYFYLSKLVSGVLPGREWMRSSPLIKVWNIPGCRLTRRAAPSQGQMIMNEAGWSDE